MEGTLADLQKHLAKKNTFESAVESLIQIVSHDYVSALPSDQNLIYAAVCRAATLLKSRYTALGFWVVGLKLFEKIWEVVEKADEKANLKSYIERAREIIGEQSEEVPAQSQPGMNSGFLFEGQLTLDPEPPRPAWLVAQSILSGLDSGQGESRSLFSPTVNMQEMGGSMAQDLEELLQQVNGLDGFSVQLEEAIQATLQDLGNGPRVAPPASKEEVAKLAEREVTEHLLAQLGEGVECAVCREPLAMGDTMQEMPCKHLFHPTCLKPWLDEHNSCPVCRHELRTDDHEYESRKEREKELEEERKGAANAVRGGEYMYI